MPTEEVKARRRRKEAIAQLLPPGFTVETYAGAGRNKVRIHRDGAPDAEAPGFFSVELAITWLNHFLKALNDARTD